MNSYLITDIGGTNCRLWLYTKESDKFNCYKIQYYKTNDYKSIYDVIELFLTEISIELIKPKYFIISVAGTVFNNKIADFANIKWPGFSGFDLIKHFSLDDCVLMNDFKAVGLGFVSKNLKLSKDCSIDKLTDMLVIGFGTGIGVVKIKNIEKNKFEVYPTESGHITLNYKSDRLKKVVSYIKNKINYSLKKPFPHELLYFSTGIPLIYDFVNNNDKISNYNSRKVINKLKENLSSKETIKFKNIIFEILLISITSLVSIFLPKGGIIMLGGVILSVINDLFNSIDEFKLELNTKLIFNKNLNHLKEKIKIDIYLNSNDELATEGCLYQLNQIVKDKSVKIN